VEGPEVRLLLASTVQHSLVDDPLGAVGDEEAQGETDQPMKQHIVTI
jgi:hypothetical protein